MRQVFLFFKILFILLFFFSPLHNPLYSSPVSYAKIDPVLTKTWEETYPISFSKIVKKDLLGKGIALIKNKKNEQEYLYTFLVFIPQAVYTENGLERKEEGREVTIKLYHTPSNKEIPYRVELGELEERHNTKNILRWIK